MLAHGALVLGDGDVLIPDRADGADVAAHAACAKAQQAHGQKTHDDPEEISVLAFGRHGFGASSACKSMPQVASQMDRVQRGRVQVDAGAGA